MPSIRQSWNCMIANATASFLPPSGNHETEHTVRLTSFGSLRAPRRRDGRPRSSIGPRPARGPTGARSSGPGTERDRAGSVLGAHSRSRRYARGPDGAWNLPVDVSCAPSSKFLEALDAGVAIVDFDVHLDDVSRDWRNPHVATWLAKHK